MKSINFKYLRLSPIMRGLLATAVIGLAWIAILFSIGLSRASSEVENYIMAHKIDLEVALTQGNIVHIHSLLMGLEKFGVESSLLKTPVFFGNQSRDIRTGRLDHTFASQSSKLILTNNGLYLGHLLYQISLSQILQRVLIYDWKLLLVILVTNLFIFTGFNYIILSEIRGLQKTLVTSIVDGSHSESTFKKSNFLARLIFSKDFGIAVDRLVNEISTLRKNELDHAAFKTERLIARQVAHDIRSPLSALNLISSQVSGSKEAIDLLRSSTERINAIASDLLQKSKSKKSHQALATDFIISPSHEYIGYITEKIEKLVAETKLRFPNARIDLTIVDKSEGATIAIDLHAFLRIATIFLNNAMEAYSNKKPEAAISLDISTELMMTIEDSGIGMPPHILRRLGEEGFSYGKKDGNGFGLHYANRIIKIMGGNLSIISAPEKGTVIKVRIPNVQTN